MERDHDADRPREEPKPAPQTGPLPLAERRRLAQDGRPAETKAQVFTDWALI